MKLRCGCLLSIENMNEIHMKSRLNSLQPSFKIKRSRIIIQITKFSVLLHRLFYHFLQCASTNLVYRAAVCTQSFTSLSDSVYCTAPVHALCSAAVHALCTAVYITTWPGISLLDHVDHSSLFRHLHHFWATRITLGPSYQRLDQVATSPPYRQFTIYFYSLLITCGATKTKLNINKYINTNVYKQKQRRWKFFFDRSVPVFNINAVCSLWCRNWVAPRTDCSIDRPGRGPWISNQSHPSLLDQFYCIDMKYTAVFCIYYFYSTNSWARTFANIKC